MQAVHKSRRLDMTQGNPARLLLAFSLPIFLGNLLQQCYNLADTALAGHMLGDAALAEIGATAALYSLITGFAFGFNNGMALLVSRFFGSGDKNKMRQAICWMVLLAAGIGMLITAGLLLLRRPLLLALQTPSDILPGAQRYITIILAGIPLTMAYNLESGLLRAVGNSVTPLLLLLFSCGLNVGLDNLFMGPLKWGVQGAAVATVLAQGFSSVLGFIYIWLRCPDLRFGRRQCRTEPGFVSEIFLTGLSMALMSTIFSIGSVILQSSINALGKIYIAAQVGGRRLVELFMMPGTALSTSIATYVSQNYGAGRRTRIMKGIKTACWMYMLWWLVALVFAFTVAPNAVRLVTGSQNNAVIGHALLYIQVSIPLFPPMGCLVIMRNALQGMRHRVAPLLCSSLELIGKILFSIWLVPVGGYVAVCACEPVTWVVCCLFILGAAWMWRQEFREQPGEEKQTGGQKDERISTHCL